MAWTTWQPNTMDKMIIKTNEIAPKAKAFFYKNKNKIKTMKLLCMLS